jgi:8-oxo-dGTP pyrophosphatase MutT (NUDIX family)
MTMKHECRCGVVLISKNTNSVLIIKERIRRTPNSGKWGLPKGQMEEIDKRNKFACAKRELREETGINLDLIQHEQSGVIRCGSTFLFIVRIDDEIKNLVVPNTEIDDAKWVNFNVLCDNFCVNNAKMINNSLSLMLKNRKKILMPQQAVVCM